jgi:F1F0 ATPase subunit 2
MNPVTLVVGFAAGLLLGWVQFQGLWTTLQRVSKSRHAGSLLLASYFIRTALTLIGLWFATRLGGAPALIATATGMIVVRMLLLRRHRPKPPSTDGQAQ